MPALPPSYLRAATKRIDRPRETRFFFVSLEQRHPGPANRDRAAASSSRRRSRSVRVRCPSKRCAVPAPLRGNATCSSWFGGSSLFGQSRCGTTECRKVERMPALAISTASRPTLMSWLELVLHAEIGAVLREMCRMRPDILLSALVPGGLDERIDLRVRVEAGRCGSGRSGFGGPARWLAARARSRCGRAAANTPSLACRGDIRAAPSSKRGGVA